MVPEYGIVAKISSHYEAQVIVGEVNLRGKFLKSH